MTCTHRDIHIHICTLYIHNMMYIIKLDGDTCTCTVPQKTVPYKSVWIDHMQQYTHVHVCIHNHHPPPPSLHNLSEYSIHCSLRINHPPTSPLPPPSHWTASDGSVHVHVHECWSSTDLKQPKMKMVRNRHTREMDVPT